MAQHRVGSKINARRAKSVTTSGAETRKLVEDITGKPYRLPHLSFNADTGQFDEPSHDLASKMQADLQDRMKNQTQTEPESRPPAKLMKGAGSGYYFAVDRRRRHWHFDRSCTGKCWTLTCPGYDVEIERRTLRELRELYPAVAEKDYPEQHINFPPEDDREPESRPHISRPAAQSLQIDADRVRFITPRDYSHCRGYVFPLAGYYAVGMREAARRSFAHIVDWRRVEQPQVSAPALTVVHSAPRTRADWTGGRRNPFRPVQDDMDIAAHITRSMDTLYPAGQMIVVDKLQRLECWRRPHTQEKTKDYSRYYPAPTAPDLGPHVIPMTVEQRLFIERFRMAHQRREIAA